MCTSYSISDSSDGMWRILRDHVQLQDRLLFATAIRPARQVTHNDCACTGITATAEIMPSGDSPFELSQFGHAFAHA